MKKYYLLFCLSFFMNCLFAVSLEQLMIIAEDGTFLGTFENKYSNKSIYNEYGDYGSKYSKSCIFNKYSDYGSDYSDYSPFNKYARKAPFLLDRNGNSYGRLSINRYAQGVTDFSYKLAYQLKAIRDSL